MDSLTSIRGIFCALVMAIGSYVSSPSSARCDEAALTSAGNLNKEPGLPAKRESRFCGEIALGASYLHASDPAAGGLIQLVLGSQSRGVQLGAVLRLDAGRSVAGLSLLLPELGLTTLVRVHRRVRVGGTATLGFLSVLRVSASEGHPLVSLLIDMSADLKVDVYGGVGGTGLYLHVAPGYAHSILVGHGFVGRLALGYRFGPARQG